MYPNIQSSIIFSSQNKEATQMTMNRWMDKDVACRYIDTHTHTYIYNGILLSHKKEWISAICTNVDWPKEYYT